MTAPKDRPDKDHVVFQVSSDVAEMRELKNYASASLFEIAVVLAASFIAFASAVINNNYDKLERMQPNELMFYWLTDPSFIVPASIVVLEVFCTLLTRYSILVSIYRFIRLPGKRDRDGSILYHGKGQPPMFVRQSWVHIRRSSDTFNTAQRRPAALLFVGTIIAVGGLALFVITAPTPVEQTAAPLSGEVLQELVGLTPRLLMLLFIQVLAGFFLRQYRTSMEEARYHERVLRMREAELAAYFLADESADGLKADLFKSLLEQKDRDFVRMQQGETTVLLEAQKMETNEFKGIIERAFDMFKREPKAS